MKFTSEEMKEDGSMPFLDILIIPTDDGSLKTSVFRKKHTQICTCNGTATTTYHQNIVWLVPYTTEQIPSAQIQHCCMKKKALRKCKYPIWAINRAKLKSQNPNRTKHRRTNNQKGPSNTNKQNLLMVVPYHQGLSERVKKHAANMGCRFTLKEDRQSRTSS